MRTASVTLGVIIGLLALSGQPSSARGSDKEVEAVLAAWKKRQKAFETARYTVAGTMEFKDETLPAGNPIRPTSLILLFDFKHGRSRQENKKDSIFFGPPIRWLTNCRSTSTFDGKEARSISSNDSEDKSHELFISKGTQAFGAFGAEFAPILYAHGIVSTGYNENRIDKWATEFDLENFEFMGQQSANGKTYDVIRTVPKQSGSKVTYEEFWIDREKDASIVRAIDWVGKNTWTVVDIEWQNIGSAWVPKKWTLAWTGPVHRIARLEVRSFEANPTISDSDFTIPSTAGMTVHEVTSPASAAGLDPRYPAQRVYKISPSGAEEPISEKGFTTFDGKAVPVTRFWQKSWFWCIVLAGAAAAIALALGPTRRFVRRVRL